MELNIYHLYPDVLNLYGNRIVEQQKKMGVSCDWSRSRFTMDDRCAKAVRETFCELYDKGLIYKGSRIINWCPHCVTALSDAEVEYVDKPGHLWHIRYPLADGSGDLVVATTRPETMMGDTGVAVNPEDERFKHLILYGPPFSLILPSSPMQRMTSRLWRRPTSKSLGSWAGVIFTAPVPKPISQYSSPTMRISRFIMGRMQVLPIPSSLTRFRRSSP